MTLVLFYISTIFRFFKHASFVEYVVKNRQANWKEGDRRTQLLILSECFIHRSTLACSYSSWKRSCIHFSHHTLLIFCNSLQTLNYICIIKFSTTAGFLALSSGSSSLRGEKTNRKKGGEYYRKKGIIFVGDQIEKSCYRVNHIILWQKSSLLSLPKRMLASIHLIRKYYKCELTVTKAQLALSNFWSNF